MDVPPLPKTAHCSSVVLVRDDSSHHDGAREADAYPNELQRRHIRSSEPVGSNTFEHRSRRPKRDVPSGKPVLVAWSIRLAGTGTRTASGEKNPGDGDRYPDEEGNVLVGNGQSGT